MRGARPARAHDARRGARPTTPAPPRRWLAPSARECRRLQGRGDPAVAPSARDRQHPPARSSSVVLPAPLGPSRTTTSPARPRCRRRGRPRRRRARRDGRARSTIVHDGRPSSGGAGAAAPAVSPAATTRISPSRICRARSSSVLACERARHGARQRLRLALDVAADQHHGAHLGERRAHRSDHRREHADARLAQGEHRHLRARRPEGARLLEKSSRTRLDRRGGERHHERQRQQGLRQVTPLSVKSRLSRPSGAPEQQQRHHEPDDDRRQPHTGVRQASRPPRPGNRPSPSARPQRQTDTRATASTTGPCAGSRRRHKDVAVAARDSSRPA